MGDPISPAMTIAACAHVEKRWISARSDTEKKHIRARRYMDDILFIYVQNEAYDYQTMVQQLKTECYTKPLELESGSDGIFLETEFEIRNNKFRYWLKNANAKEKKIWRYQHWYSHASYQQKRALARSCLRRVHGMACDNEAIMKVAREKIREFKDIGYPYWLLKRACAYVATVEKDPIWSHIRKEI